jgi:hypothetical protein
MVLGDNNSRRLAVAYRIGGVLCVLAAAQVASAADGQPPLKAIAAIVLTPADIRSVTNEPNVRGSGLFTTARTASLVPKCGVGTGTGGGARSQYVAQDLSKPTKPAFGIGSIVLVEPSVGAAASDLTAFHRAGFPRCFFPAGALPEKQTRITSPRLSLPKTDATFASHVVLKFPTVAPGALYYDFSIFSVGRTVVVLWTSSTPHLFPAAWRQRFLSIMLARVEADPALKA